MRYLGIWDPKVALHKAAVTLYTRLAWCMERDKRDIVSIVPDPQKWACG